MRFLATAATGPGCGYEELVDLEPIQGCPDRVLGMQAMEESRPILICAIAD
jgi:hypothetical protein